MINFSKYKGPSVDDMNEFLKPTDRQLECLFSMAVSIDPNWTKFDCQKIISKEIERYNVLDMFEDDLFWDCHPGYGFY